MTSRRPLSIKQLFDAGALDYDGNRRKVIPCFDEFYATVIRLIPFEPERPFSFLDLGAGTGLVAALIVKTFPEARGTLLDISDKMLEKAGQRFAGHPRIRCVVSDYDISPLPGTYDLIVSAMSIHHLEDFSKRLLVQRIYEALDPGGTFIHAELVRGATEAAEAGYQARWQEHLRQTDLSDRQLSTIYDRMAYDRPATLEAQLRWMGTAGFEDVDCYYKYYNFAVYAGNKSKVALP